MRFRVVFANRATRTLTAREVAHKNVLAVTLGRDASRILMAKDTDGRDVDQLVSAYTREAERLATLRDCTKWCVYVSKSEGGHQVAESK